VAVGNHAAADHREGGRALFPAVPSALAASHRSGRGKARRSAEALGRIGLLRPCSQSSRLCSRNPRKAWRPLPQTEAELLTLPGIGAYTAAAIAAIAFDRKASPVDGNIERVVTRLFAIEEALPTAKPIIRARAAALTPDARPGDFAQAMMDLGAMVCTPKNPACALCPWSEPCLARARGDQETFPRKTPKAEGRLRRGAAFVVIRKDGALLVRTRPDKGLLAKMTEVPTTQWTHDFDDANALDEAPLKATWQRMAGVVNHVFTHFPLELVVYRAHVAQATRAPRGMRWIAADEIEGEAFPNVMRKVIAHARADTGAVRPHRKSL
jgi:A/G-specific adenine glycosylase